MGEGGGGKKRRRSMAVGGMMSRGFRVEEEGGRRNEVRDREGEANSCPDSSIGNGGTDDCRDARRSREASPAITTVVCSYLYNNILRNPTLWLHSRRPNFDARDTHKKETFCTYLGERDNDATVSFLRFESTSKKGRTWFALSIGRRTFCHVLRGGSASICWSSIYVSQTFIVAGVFWY